MNSIELENQPKDLVELVNEHLSIKQDLAATASEAMTENLKLREAVKRLSNVIESIEFGYVDDGVCSCHVCFNYSDKGHKENCCIGNAIKIINTFKPHKKLITAEQAAVEIQKQFGKTLSTLVY